MDNCLKNSDKNKQTSVLIDSVPRKKGGLTCVVCTWGDWMTDDCADWITPWTWNWPPGSCTTATEEPPSDIYKNTDANLNPQNTIYLSGRIETLFKWNIHTRKWLRQNYNIITSVTFSGDSFCFYVLGNNKFTTKASPSSLDTLKKRVEKIVNCNN